MGIFPWIKLSSHSCSLWDKLGWLNWFWPFLCEVFSSFDQKRFYYSYAWSCSLCERKTIFCTGILSRKLCGSLLTFSTSSTSLSVLFLFLLLITFFVVMHGFWFYFVQHRWSSPSSFLCTVFDSILSNIDEVLSINPSATVFVFENLNVHHKDWLTYFSGTDRPGELCCNFKWPYSDG